MSDHDKPISRSAESTRMQEGEMGLTLTKVCGGKVYGAAMRFTARQITYGPKKMLAEAAEKLQYDIERYMDFGIEKERQK